MTVESVVNPADPSPLSSRHILGMRVDATSYQDATRRILDWAQKQESRYVCVSNVHMTMESYDNPEFRTVVNSADLVTPDGMPLVWCLRQMGIHEQQRVYGPTLTLHVCEAAAEAGVPLGLYGGQEHVLAMLCDVLQERYPKLNIAYQYSPPFRELSAQEQGDIIGQIHQSGARILLVGLGCPKQERWMHAHAKRLQAVMVGVGAAFDFHAGVVRQSPALLQRMGLEWLFRLTMEPRRLWKRYAKHNPRFVGLVLQQLAGLRRFDSDEPRR